MEHFSMENINYLDAVLGGIVILSALIGLARGLVKEMLSLIAWAVAIYVAWRFSEQIANQYIRQFIQDDLISYLAAFGLIFLGVLFVVGLLNLIITQILTSAGMGGFDRFLGMLFGLVRGLVIATLTVFIIGLTPLNDEGWWKNSELRPGFANVGDWAWRKLPPKVRDLLHNGGASIAEITHDELTDDKSQIAPKTTQDNNSGSAQETRDNRLTSPSQPTATEKNATPSIRNSATSVQSSRTVQERSTDTNRDASLKRTTKSTDASPVAIAAVQELPLKEHPNAQLQWSQPEQQVNGRSAFAERPTAVASDKQRNQISALGEQNQRGGIQLESLSSSAKPTTPAKNQLDKLVPPSPPPLRLESTQ